MLREPRLIDHEQETLVIGRRAVAILVTVGLSRLQIDKTVVCPKIESTHHAARLDRPADPTVVGLAADIQADGVDVVAAEILAVVVVIVNIHGPKPSRVEVVAALLFRRIGFAGTTHGETVVIKIVDHRVGVDEVKRCVLNGIRAAAGQRAAMVVGVGGGLVDGKAKHCSSKAFAFVADAVRSSVEVIVDGVAKFLSQHTRGIGGV